EIAMLLCGGMRSYCRPVAVCLPFVAFHLTYLGWGGDQMRALLLPFERRYIALTASIVAAAASLGLAQLWPALWLLFVPAAALPLLGLHALLQSRHTILRSYPIAAHFRFLLETIRPEIRQYFLEDDSSGTPFARKKRSIVYQRAKGQLDKVPFGT